MPRKAREKTKESIFHIMARSISEVDLFRDKADKLQYLKLVKKYQILYQFRVYGYCLMDNHVHMIIDANGADISDIMHSINFAYALYFNMTHKRHGHLFQDRFRSEMVNDLSYLLALSAYVHNNPTDIRGYEDCPERYEFSSLSVYLGLRQDPYELVKDEFVLGMFGKNPKTARERYMKLVYTCNEKDIVKDIEFKDEKTEYRSQRHILVRDMDVEEIIEFIIDRMGITKVKMHSKYCKRVVEAKALLVFMLRSLCNLRCGSICRILGNITQSRVSMLSSIGIGLIDDERYRGIVEEFMACYAA